MNVHSFSFPIAGSDHMIIIKQVLYGADGWQIYVDNYYQGTIRKTGGKWTAHMNRGCLFQGDDLAGLVDLAAWMEAENRDAG